MIMAIMASDSLDSQLLDRLQYNGDKKSRKEIINNMLAFNAMTDEEILRELGCRLREYRLQQDLTAETVAERAGLSASTVLNAEGGRNPTMETLVRILRVLGRLEGLEAFLPAPTVSPMELLRRRKAKKRQRASGRRREPMRGNDHG